MQQCDEPRFFANAPAKDIGFLLVYTAILVQIRYCNTLMNSRTTLSFIVAPGGTGKTYRYPNLPETAYLLYVQLSRVSVPDSYVVVD